MALNVPEAPREQRLTTWHNPLPTPQHVDVHMNGKLVRFTVPPHGDKEIPSEFDYAIHRVTCGDMACRNKTGFCQKGHEGTVVAGLAPQLQNKTVQAKRELAVALDTQASAKEQAEAEAAAASLARDRAERTELVAAMRVKEFEAKKDAEAKAPAPKAEKSEKK